MPMLSIDDLSMRTEYAHAGIYASLSTVADWRGLALDPPGRCRERRASSRNGRADVTDANKDRYDVARQVSSGWSMWVCSEGAVGIAREPRGKPAVGVMGEVAR